MKWQSTKNNVSVTPPGEWNGKIEILKVATPSECNGKIVIKVIYYGPLANGTAGSFAARGWKWEGRKERAGGMGN